MTRILSLTLAEKGRGYDEEELDSLAIVFELPNGGRVEVRENGGYLTVRSANGSIRILPVATNDFRVGVETPFMYDDGRCKPVEQDGDK